MIGRNTNRLIGGVFQPRFFYSDVEKSLAESVRKRYDYCKPNGNNCFHMGKY